MHNGEVLEFHGLPVGIAACGQKRNTKKIITAFV